MAQRDAGLYSILHHERAYETIQRLMGATALRQMFVREYVQAKPGDRVLDIGCGVGPYLSYLPSVEYSGWDPSGRYIEHARRMHGDRGNFNVGMFGPKEAAATQPVDIVILSAVLHHMSDVEATTLFRLLRDILKSGGRVVSMDNVFIAHQNPIARFLVSIDRGRHVRTAAAYEALARSSFAQVRGKVVEKAFPPYTYFFMVAQ